jgi:hypothetical protein
MGTAPNLSDALQAPQSNSPTREQIDRLQAAMLAMQQADIPAEHTFGPGFYARTIRIPAGTVLVGKVHSTEHLFIISKGEIALATEDGTQIVKAPFQTVCRPGLKRVGAAITDVVCTNIHLTNETDLDALERLLIEPEPMLQAAAKERLQ